jgi:hypothetical protein
MPVLPSCVIEPLWDQFAVLFGWLGMSWLQGEL